MPPIRVLIVDDSTVIRRLVTEVLSADPEIEVVGVAANGAIALAKVGQCQPDVITLDMEMPEVDGLETLTQLRKSHPQLPVIMFSTLTARGAAETLEALARGAKDYVTKPANVGSVTVAMQAVRDELVPKIKTFGRRRQPSLQATPGKAIASLQPRTGISNPNPQPIDIIAIGVSTGGPNALASVFQRLPRDLPVPIVVVQHMPPVFTQQLAERLNNTSPLSVSEAREGERLSAGHAYLAPGGRHLEVCRVNSQAILQLTDSPPENSCRPAVDVLFRSIGQTFGARALAVVLTGMGQDGLRGAASIRQLGGRVFAQDEASSVVWGMPGSVVQAGLAEKVLALENVSDAIIAAAKLGRARSDAPQVKAQLI